MRGLVPPDPETSVSEMRFAVVYAPKRKRNRFAASCVEPVADASTALSRAVPDQNRFAAKVLGPSKSSEGQYIYYLLDWL